MLSNPTYDILTNSDGKANRWSFAMNMHPNPRYYKYLWRVFYRDMPEGEAFFRTPELSTYEAMMLCEQLEKRGEGYLIYNSQQPREGKDTPFNRNSSRWKDSVFALSYDDDEDLEWNGFK